MASLSWLKRLYSDGVGGRTRGEHGKERRALLALRPDDGDVPGVGIGGQQNVLVR